MMLKNMKRFDKFLQKAGIKNSFGYDFYFENYIFNGINLENKEILDLGGGNGIASFHALNKCSSCNCFVVDPIEEGSNKLMVAQFNEMKKNFKPGRIFYHRDFIDTLDNHLKFDIVLMHNSINHIGEDIIDEIEFNKHKYQEYLSRIDTITKRLKKDGLLIIADCGSKNFWNNLNLKDPFAPSIDWSLHKEPEIWRKMIEEIGHQHIDTYWTSRKEFGKLGKLLFANRFLSYFIGRHFVSKFIKI
tara:strand:- start:1627 stop:2361 length:735 start_codon:yes stop_codon:yes gene_type:complete